MQDAALKPTARAEASAVGILPDLMPDPLIYQHMTDNDVSAVARRLMVKHHADGEEPDSAEFDRVWKARDSMLEERR